MVGWNKYTLYVVVIYVQSLCCVTQLQWKCDISKKIGIVMHLKIKPHYSVGPFLSHFYKIFSELSICCYVERM